MKSTAGSAVNGLVDSAKVLDQGSEKVLADARNSATAAAKSVAGIAADAAKGWSLGLPRRYLKLCE